MRAAISLLCRILYLVHKSCISQGLDCSVNHCNSVAATDQMSANIVGLSCPSNTSGACHGFVMMEGYACSRKYNRHIFEQVTTNTRFWNPATNNTLYYNYLPGNVFSTKYFLKSHNPKLAILGVSKSVAGIKTSLGLKSPCIVGVRRLCRYDIPRAIPVINIAEN